MSPAASLRLDNGLTVRLLHDAQASEAAALLQVASGSDNEPEQWPGLAHLLEHLLFTGSARYTGQQRLMSWVPAQGGRLNATTRADRTAYFFSLPASGLEAGLARLVDMLAHPLLASEAIMQETAVIDAEYRLLRQDTQTLSGVAQRHFFHGPPAMQRFHVGSRASFGEEIPRLRQALEDFHQQRYHAGAMTLWLSGPQPLSELEAIARRCGASLPASAGSALLPSAHLQARADATVRTAGATQLTLTFALNRWQESDAGWCALLQQLLLDEAEGGLLAQLRAADACDGVSLQEVWRGGGAALIAVCFLPAHPRPPLSALLEGALRQWLAQLAAFTSSQLNHYLQLAQRQFAGKSALDRLREQAFGFAPPASVTSEEWQRWLKQLQNAAVSRLWLDETVQGELTSSAGFEFISAPWTSIPRSGALPLRFWPFPPLPAPHILPDDAVPLLHLPSSAPAVLTLRPVPDKPITDPLGYALQAALRALSASFAHQGGRLNVERQQGIWQLQLSGEPTLMLAQLAAVVARLQAFTPSEAGARAWQREQQKEQGEIPVRRLLNRLPGWLLAQQPACTTLDKTVWQAALVGGSQALAQKLARLLSRMPGRVQHAAGWQQCKPQPGQQHYLRLTQGDTALLLFCPLTQPDLEAQLAWRMLALIYQPAFFQRLRVEQQVGYVVSCSFHHVANSAGVLFALQSPQIEAAALLTHIQRFLLAMEGEIAQLAADELVEKRERLWQRLQPDGDALEQARQTLAFPDLASPAARSLLESLDAPRLVEWHRALCNGAHWWQCAAEAG
ncbi:pyrroloquinoline quinone biosynthesis protein PqqF [Mixta theicola]|uniref:Coenzyme PQQ synthesis protein F n=1 Tax=Mixta theicola TaxID=1458355 RepID=A0A2K1Q9S9_9GAMM|nr:pyrroloquinoline quinone biosynthesis protein PqqF [Mixta theicola]PNS11784.1 pyrroloquinoline quinone biosynthesis protein PqqF [Mixta theicola]GLR07700.1 coenzyme PQQ synthesis protein F [Mixta theicola]